MTETSGTPGRLNRFVSVEELYGAFLQATVAERHNYGFQ